MSDPYAQLNQADLDLLSAYLDGQVDAEERMLLETRLAAEPALRQAFNELRGTVELLRALPPARPPRSFTLDPVSVPQPWWRRFELLRSASALSAVLAVVVVLFGRLSSTTPAVLTSSGNFEAMPAAPMAAAAPTAPPPAPMMAPAAAPAAPTVAAAAPAPAATMPPSATDLPYGGAPEATASPKQAPSDQARVDQPTVETGAETPTTDPLIAGSMAAPEATPEATISIAEAPTLLPAAGNAPEAGGMSAQSQPSAIEGSMAPVAPEPAPINWMVWFALGLIGVAIAFGIAAWRVRPPS